MPGSVGGARQLAEQTAARLASAGIRGDDPGLVQLRAWNRGALARGRISVETRPGHYMVTTLDQLRRR